VRVCKSLLFRPLVRITIVAEKKRPTTDKTQEAESEQEKKEEREKDIAEERAFEIWRLTDKKRRQDRTEMVEKQGREKKQKQR